MKFAAASPGWSRGGTQRARLGRVRQVCRFTIFSISSMFRITATFLTLTMLLVCALFEVGAAADGPMAQASSPAALGWRGSAEPVQSGFPATSRGGPFIFEPNVGQTDPKVQFLSRGRDFALFLTRDEMVLGLSRSDAARQAVVRMTLHGADPRLSVTGLEKLPGTVNYIMGDDRARWRTDVPTYARVKY